MKTLNTCSDICFFNACSPHFVMVCSYSLLLLVHSFVYILFMWTHLSLLQHMYLYTFKVVFMFATDVFMSGVIPTLSLNLHITYGFTSHLDVDCHARKSCSKNTKYTIYILFVCVCYNNFRVLLTPSPLKPPPPHMLGLRLLLFLVLDRCE